MRLAALVYYHIAKRTGLVRRSDYSHFSTSTKFDRLYALDDDPFNIESSEYEAQKALDFNALLSKPRYAAILDVGCGTGRVTRRLASIADTVHGVDFSAEAIRRGREFCADLQNVVFDTADMRAYRPARRFDLIVCSEVLYYLSGNDLELALESISAAAAPQAEIIAVTRWDHEETRDALERRFSLEEETRRPDTYRPYTTGRYRVP